jgi:drug/metabolite transporter (DMT)-like permease
MGPRGGANEMTALEETADRQSLWSSTAGVLKRRVESARWVTFAFSILGALLAAIASQLNDPPRMYFAIAGAVLLAVVSFVTSRLLVNRPAAWVVPQFEFGAHGLSLLWSVE